MNKIALAVLVTLLVVIGINNLGEIVFHEEHLEANAYPIEVEMAAADTGAAVEEEKGPTLAALLATASAADGEKVFKKCKACHTAEEGGKNGTGPNLWGIVGRPKGSHEGFGYSDAMHAKGGNWTYEDLDHFLTKPKDFVPGTKMAFAGLKKPEDRAELIMFLHTLSNNPLPLPAVEEVADQAAGDAAEAVDAAAEAAEAEVH
ncbi:c-type cytochrome [Emcibacter nanhaiensis]|uniref:c-type cytochrome n=1 Tax=Emcibacter nanhaiensis TaxID=1505037 RepID=UPI001C616584|nr:cytochrome c family protein [Emcibacter nanhaiensis]